MGLMLTPSIRGLAFALALPLAAGAARAPKAAPKAKAPAQAINLNTATATELMQLPHIGAQTAGRIVQFRKEHGGFKRPEELMSVKGIGEKSFAQLRPYLTVAAK